jgi:hypothetical protein
MVMKNHTIDKKISLNPSTMIAMEKQTIASACK